MCQFVNRARTLPGLDARMRRLSSDFDFINPYAFSRGLHCAFEALPRFQYEYRLRLQREPLGNRSGRMTADFLI